MSYFSGVEVSVAPFICMVLPGEFGHRPRSPNGNVIRVEIRVNHHTTVENETRVVDCCNIHKTVVLELLTKTETEALLPYIIHSFISAPS